MPPGPRAIKPQASVWLNERVAGARRKRPAEPSASPSAIAGGGRRAAVAEPRDPLGPQQPTGLDLDLIIRTTIRMLDADGLAKFSMRRLAAELGVTPMSVYWYVDNKDDLLEITLDEIGGEVPLPGDGSDQDWRVQLREVTAGYRAMLVTHPWASRLMGEYLNVGPKAAAVSTAMYRIVRRTGLPDAMISGALSTVYQFTYGFGTVEGRWGERCRAAGVGEDEMFREMSGAIRDHPGFHGLADLIDRRVQVPLADLRERDFAFSLDCVIAGIEAMRDRARG